MAQCVFTEQRALEKAFNMSDFKFSCPHCTQHLLCDESFSGRQIQCPHCQHLIVIPHIPGRTAEFKAEAGLTWATYLGPASQEQKPQLPRPPGTNPKP